MRASPLLPPGSGPYNPASPAGSFGAARTRSRSASFSTYCPPPIVVPSNNSSDPAFPGSTSPSPSGYPGSDGGSEPEPGAGSAAGGGIRGYGQPMGDAAQPRRAHSLHVSAQSMRVRDSVEAGIAGGSTAFDIGMGSPTAALLERRHVRRQLR
ncbi:unnamed protein product [Closterium sp. Naga37s-1]|nr:unnamed protein product [Closterium sp. Naga37s-1]CAI5934012.1 unnamed protein product [Closterium sp. NIES-65]CAI5973017.1 unnamed protein product [Closterium sp. NIES-65]